MGGVVSFGSVNGDCVASVTQAEIDDLAERYPWFPAPGETRKLDRIPEEFLARSWETFTGGKGANQAVAARRAGAETRFLGKVGADDAGDRVRSSLEASGVDVEHVGVSVAPTGRAYVFVSDDGENYIAIVPGANGEVDSDYVRPLYDSVVDADCLLLQNEIPLAPMEELLERLEGEVDRPTVIVNPAPAAGAHRLLSYASVDYVTPNETEYAAIRPHLDAFGGTLIRTRGEAAVRVEGAAEFAVEPPAVDVVDSTGAGDVFNGYLAAGLSAGDALEDAVETATVAASLSIRETGAQAAIPEFDDVIAFSR